MQATTGTTPKAQPTPLPLRGSKLPEYVYQVAILLAVLLLLWTVV